MMKKPSAAITTNGARQPHCATSSAPTVGATTGAAVKIIVMSDMRRAASLPEAMSRTIARDRTMADEAPTPCTNRATSRTSMFCAAAATMPATANSPMPT